MALSWNEIKDRAVKFSKEWENDFNEDAEAKSFMDDFFNVFGIPRRRVASFEKHVKKTGGKQGFIDLLWKGVILIEFKSRGKDLDKAHTQARGYFPGLKDAELPRYILVSDFARFRLYDLEEDITIEFKLQELVNNVQHFGFIAGYQKQVYKEQDPVNIKAAELMGRLHDRLEDIGYQGHSLEVYLVRLLFCLFAEDTTIFIRQEFQNFIEQRTSPDGSDLAAKLQQLFEVLNTPPDKRFTNLDEQLNSFPYVNGKLFEEPLRMASFDSKMRQALLDCCYLDWSQISPAIFGSMFQSVMNPQERRNLGAHYTSEKNILKLIKPLFLDELWQEFEKIKSNRNKLNEFHKRLSTLKFLDPACGCGNFLVITYRELRLLEIAILRALNKNGQGFLDVRDIIWLDVDMMYGIEYEEFPARIAEVAMWLMDHQMNMLISNEFGQYFARLPLKKAATIVHGNALRIDWEDVVSKTELSYIIGNPPFIGHHIQTELQKSDLHYTLKGIKAAGVMDYVSAWYYKAAEYIQNTIIKAAFVSTNSIVQGEQVGILWLHLINNFSIKIHFAHRTFKWSNEARGNAAVYCVIIGFANFDTNNKVIYEYEDIKAEPHELHSKNINPYLVDAKDIIISNNSSPICEVPKMMYGNKPTDGGNFLLTDQEKINFLINEPKADIFIKPFLSAREYINGEKRWCIWLVDSDPNILKQCPSITERIRLVKNFRGESKAATTRNYKFHNLFRQITQPKSDFLLIPRTTSENRNYIPIGFFTKDFIVGDTCQAIPDATLYHFGVLTSIMHMAWVKTTCGRLKSDYRYSKDIVYNNYPWPENPSDKHIKAIEKAAQKVLEVREQFPGSSLADLYHPLTMPPALVKAHNALDKAVDLAYRPQPFVSEAKRMEFLFELYEKYTAGLFSSQKPKKAPKTKK
ncbi:DNA methyltransferase [Flavobacterium rhizosphaerae]|uniref:site-specific DNA-methyltransferase (adenine-specific) n=1 Tax=Flavobacterium rhizosphaerae TaxID=3163298 RepID=A0ABW8YXK3_9FLAO